jgi:hypothetical protein
MYWVDIKNWPSDQTVVGSNPWQAKRPTGGAKSGFLDYIRYLAMGCYPGPTPANWAGSGCCSTGQRTACTNYRPAAHRRAR